MLRGKEVVTIGWSRFVANHDDSLQQGHLTGNKYDGKDLAPNRMIILRREDATSLEVDLIQSWDPLSTWRQLQDRLGGVMRSLIHERPELPTGPHILIATGGSGGHLYPAFAVADEIERRWPEAQVRLTIGARAIER